MCFPLLVGGDKKEKKRVGGEMFLYPRFVSRLLCAAKITRIESCAGRSPPACFIHSEFVFEGSTRMGGSGGICRRASTAGAVNGVVERVVQSTGFLFLR